MAFMIGAALALLVGLLATFSGLDRDRAFYPTVTIVIASYYALFAVMGGSVHALLVESIVIVAFAAYGLLDFTHGQLIANPVIPAWRPSFCLSFDVMAAAYLAWLLLRSRVSAVAT